MFISFDLGSRLLAQWPVVFEGSSKISGSKRWETSWVNWRGLLGFTLKMVLAHNLFWWKFARFLSIRDVSCAGVHILEKQPTSPDQHSYLLLPCFAWRLLASPWSPQKWHHLCRMKPRFKTQSGFATFGPRGSKFCSTLRAHKIDLSDLYLLTRRGTVHQYQDENHVHSESKVFFFCWIWVH